MDTIFKVLKSPSSLILWVISFDLSYVAFSLSPHIHALSEAYRLDNSLGAEGDILFATVRSLLFHTTEPTLVPTTLLAFLFALIIVLLVHYYRIQGSVLIQTSGSGITGVVLGLLGVGCSACGTLALTAALGAVGLSGLVLLLPFRGAEFLYLGVLIMLFSVWQLVQLIQKPLTC